MTGPACQAQVSQAKMWGRGPCFLRTSQRVIHAICPLSLGEAGVGRSSHPGLLVHWPLPAPSSVTGLSHTPSERRGELGVGHSTWGGHVPFHPARLAALWAEQVALRSQPRCHQQIGLPHSPAHRPASCWAAGAWPSTSIRGAGPIEPCPASAGSSRTRSLGTPEGHGCYPAAFLFCSSWEALFWTVTGRAVPLTSAGWWCAARPTYSLSGLLLLGAHKVTVRPR